MIPESLDVNDSCIPTSSQSESLPPLITLIRHPQTLANQAHLLQGSTDSELSSLGRSQLEALREHWSSIHKDQVTLILSSPLGRTRKVAEALQTVVFRGSSSSTASKPSIIFRYGLKERDFGGLESSRKGRYVEGFPKGKGSGESKDRFTRRVKEEAKFLFELAHGNQVLESSDMLVEESDTRRKTSNTFGGVDKKGKRKLEDGQSPEDSPVKKQFNQPSDKQDSTVSEKPSQSKHHQFSAANINFFLPRASRDDPSSPSPPSSPSTSALSIDPLQSRSIPSTSSDDIASISNQGSTSFPDAPIQKRTHLLVITHGLWLATFFRLHNLHLPFASNTGVYTLSVHYEIPKNSFSANPKEKLSLKVLKANDVKHLAGMGTSGSSSGRSAKDKFAVAGSDPKQGKLTGFFKPKNQSGD